MRLLPEPRIAHDAQEALPLVARLLLRRNRVQGEQICRVEFIQRLEISLEDTNLTQAKTDIEIKSEGQVE